MKRRLLCIGNGGLIRRGTELYHHGFLGQFLGELAGPMLEVCFCGWAQDSEDLVSQTPLRKIEGVRAIGLRPFQGSYARRVLNGAISASQLALEIRRADFVYLFWPGRLSMVAAQVCRLMLKPYGIYFRGKEHSPTGVFARSFRGASFILTAGEELRDIARGFNDRVEVVTPMNYVRPEHLREPVIRERRPVHLLYVGRLEASKGIPELLTSLELLLRRGVDFRCTLVGHHENVEALRSTVSAEVAARLTFTGAVSDFGSLMLVYEDADLFVLASHHEGFPRVLYEAMTFGIPIVTTFVGGIPNVMQDEINCLRIEVGSPEDIAEKVERVVDNHELRETLAAGAHATIAVLMAKWRNRSHARQIVDWLSRTT